MELEYDLMGNDILGDTMYLVVFKETSLRPTSYIDLGILEKALKYNVSHNLRINVLKDKSLELECKLNIRQLLKDCPEVYEFAKKYYVQHTM